MKKNYFTEISYIFFLVTLYSLLALIYSLDHINSHWTSFYDDEMTLTYNALLFNSGIEQEYTDHSGYFTILFASVYFKILSFFDLIKVHNINEINRFTLNEIFKDSVFHLRIFSTFLIIATGVLATYLFQNLFKNKFFAFFLGLILFLLYGNLTQLNSVRNEQFAFFFLILSLISLYHFFYSNKFLYLIIFFFFMFCSILNKSQIIYHLPLILLFSYFINKKKIIYNFEFNLSKKKEALVYIYCFFFLYITLKSLIFGQDYKSWIYLLSLIIIINFFFLKISNKKTIFENLILVNMSIIFGYVFFNLFVFLHPSASLVSINKTIFSVVNNTASYREEISSASFFEFFISIFLMLITNFFNIIEKFFLTLNSYSLIFYSIFLILFFNYREYKYDEKKLFFFILFAFFGIHSINLIRGDHLYYYVFTDYILILLLGFLLKKVKKSIYIIVLLLITIVVFYLNFYNNFKDNDKSVHSDKISFLCNDFKNNDNSYFIIWHKKIPKSKFKDFCMIEN